MVWQPNRLLIDGKLVEAEGGKTYDNVNPATEEVIGTAPDASPADFDRAIAAARHAFDETDWSTNKELRARVLRQLHEAMVESADEFKKMITAELGAPTMLLDGPHYGAPLAYLTYYADLIEKYEWVTDLGVAETMAGPSQRWIEREAAGVVGAITPWNYPTQINLAKTAPALAAGCTVVLKGAPDTPWSALALAELVAEKTDMPPGVFNVLTAQDKAIGELITTDPRVDMVSFTGSTAVGRRIMEAGAATLKRVFLELGGKSAHIVLDDVEDMAAAAGMPCFAVCTHAGQGCATPTRLLVPRSRYDEAIEACVNLMGLLPYGDPTDPGNLMGPIINASQRDRIERLVNEGVAEGARLVAGGKRPEGGIFDKGFWFEPTLFADVDNSMQIAREEIFGPVLVVIPYEDDDDAVRIANDSIFGLSGGVMSADRDRAFKVARRIRTGTLSVNGGLWYGPDVPFGGYKQSGIGREMGVAGFEEYLEQKAIAEPPRA